MGPEATGSDRSFDDRKRSRCHLTTRQLPTNGVRPAEPAAGYTMSFVARSVGFAYA